MGSGAGGVRYVAGSSRVPRSSSAPDDRRRSPCVASLPGGDGCPDDRDRVSRSVRSLTSMSTTGDRSVGQPDISAIGGLGAPPEDRQGYIDWQVWVRQSVAAIAPGER